MEPEQDLKKLLTSVNPADVAVMKSLLDAAGIPYVFRGEYLAQWSALMGPAVLMVRADREQEVRELLHDFLRPD